MSAENATERAVAAWIREYRVFVAELDGAVVGGVRLQQPESDRAKISRLAVREDRQGIGVGSNLLERAEGAAREAGRDRVRLTTPPDHPTLPEFYRRRGYEEVGPYPLEDRDYDEVRLEKRLR